MLPSGGAVIKNLPANAGDSRDVSSITGSGRSPGEGNGYPLQDSCLENSMDRGDWWVTVHEVPKSQTWLSEGTHRVHIPRFVGSWLCIKLTCEQLGVRIQPCITVVLTIEQYPHMSELWQFKSCSSRVNCIFNFWTVNLSASTVAPLHTLRILTSTVSWLSILVGE